MPKYSVNLGDGFVITYESTPVADPDVCDWIEGSDELSLSEEGKSGSHHVEKPRKWEKYKGVPLKFSLEKSALYLNSINNVGINFSEIKYEEDRCFKHIVSMLNSGGYIHNYICGGNVKLSECDLHGRNTARLLYWVDDTPPVIYFGFAFKRSEMGHVSQELANKVVKSILIRRAQVIEEIKKKLDAENAKKGK
jgi:hypothetical protein